MNLIDYVKQNKIATPIELKIGIVKVVPDRYRQGNDARYMRVYIGDIEVSRMVAEFTGLKVSHSRNAYETVIIHGSGMDMCFALADSVRSHAYYEGYPDMFSDYYKYMEVTK